MGNEDLGFIATIKKVKFEKKKEKENLHSHLGFLQVSLSTENNEAHY